MRDTKITNVNLVKNHLLHSAQKKHIHTMHDRSMQKLYQKYSENIKKE